jgi:hypothetical protein
MSELCVCHVCHVCRVCAMCVYHMCVPCAVCPLPSQANWQIVMDAAAETDALCSGDCARFYFFLVRITAGMIILPMFVGFVIESFNSTLPLVTADYLLTRENKTELVATPALGRVGTSGLVRQLSNTNIVNVPHRPDPLDLASAMATPLGRSVRDTMAMFAGSDDLPFGYDLLRDPPGGGLRGDPRALRPGSGERTSSTSSGGGGGGSRYSHSLGAGLPLVPEGPGAGYGAAGLGLGAGLPETVDEEVEDFDDCDVYGEDSLNNSVRPGLLVHTPLGAPLLPEARGGHGPGHVRGDVLDLQEPPGKRLAARQSVYRLRSKRRAADVHMSTFGSVVDEEGTEAGRAASLQRRVDALVQELEARRGEVLALTTLLQRRRGSSHDSADHGK